MPKATELWALMGVTFFTLELEGETAADCKFAGKFMVHLTSKTRVVKWVNGRDEKAKLGDLQGGSGVPAKLRVRVPDGHAPRLCYCSRS